MVGTSHAVEGDRARTAGQGGQPCPAHADRLDQYPGRAVGDGRWPHARRPHPVAAAIAGAQRPAADRADHRDGGAHRIRRLHARDGRPRRADRRDGRSHHRRPGGAAAHPHLPPGRHGGAPAAGDPLFPRRRLGDGQPRRLRPGVPLFLRPRRLRGGRRRLPPGARAQVPGRHRRRRRRLSLAAGRGDGTGHRSGAHRHRGRFGRRQRRRRGGAASARRGAPALPAMADLPGHRLQLRHALLPELRRGLHGDPRRHGMVPRPLSERPEPISAIRAPRRSRPTTSRACRRRWSTRRASIRCATRARPMPIAWPRPA